MKIRWAAGLAALVFFSAPLAAQNTAVIVGNVTDSTGAVIPGAEVTATHSETGRAAQVQTNENGAYVLAALELGAYAVEVSSEGFKTFRRPDIVLNVRDRIRVDVQLDLGEVTEVIEVTSQVVALQTENASVEEVVSGKQVANLAMNGRNFMQLAALVPGANNNNNGGFNTPTGVGSGSAANISFNGMRRNHNVWRVDGQENYDRGCGGCVEVLPSIDAIQEFKVSTANAEVDAGFGAGGQINIAIKSGTQEYHGTVYEFLRNDAFDARNPFRTGKQKLRYNNYGFNIGGPISFGGYNKDKTRTFFFLNQEWRKIRNERNFNVAAVSAPLRQGDFSELLGGSSPLEITDPDTGAPFANNKIPDSRIDPNAAILADPGLVLPLPTNAAGNFVDGGGQPLDVTQSILRVDQNIGDRNRVFFRYIMDFNSQEFATTQWSNQSYPTIGTAFSNNPKKFMGQWTSTISPNVINEFTIGFSRQPLALDPTGNYERPAGLNIPELFPDNRANRLPNLIFDGILGVNINNGSWPWTNVLDTWQFRNSTVWNRGNHTIRIGAEYMPFDKQQDFFGPTQGEFRFRTAGTGHEFANFLLGRADRYSELQEQKSPNYQTRSGGVWVSDTWRASSNLTMTFALRYDQLPHSFVENDELAAFFPSLFNLSDAPTVLRNGQIAAGTGNLLNGIGIAGQNGLNRGLVTNHNALFAPRLGIAYRPFGEDTVLRVGYGIFYERIQGNDIYNVGPNPPFASTPIIFNTELSSPGGEAAIFPGSIRTYDGPYKIPQIQNWNLGFQHRIAGGVVANLAYVGSAGTYLQTVRNINQPALPDAARVKAGEANLNQVRPYPGWAHIRSYENSTNSFYNSLQFSLRTDNWHGLTLQTAYTWSKALDYTSGDVGGTKHQDSFNTKPERGPADFDRAHMLIVSYVYDIPIPQNWRSSGIQHVLGGWTLSGITQIQTGTPLNILVSGDPVGLGDCGQCRPNVLDGNPNYARGSRSVQEWFNTSLFLDASAVTPGMLGSAGRNMVRRAGANNFDVSLFKNFTFGERFRVQFRAEMFNFFNNTQFTGFVNRTGNQRFGEVTSARDARTTQLGLKFYF